MKHDPEALTVLCQALAEHLGVAGVILITLQPGQNTGFSLHVPEVLATQVPPTLWALGDHFAEVIGCTPFDYADGDEAEPAEGVVRKH